MAKLSMIWGLVLVVGATAWVANAQSSGLPQLDQNEWWGSQVLLKDSATLQSRKTIKPFHVTFSQEMIDYLKRRISNHRSYVPPLEGTAFEYGFNPDQIGTWADYWVNEYNFTTGESVLNQFPQYKTNVQGLDMHFIWVKPEVPDGVTSVPLLLLHGFPGSIREFFEAIPLLTTPTNGLVFEVIVPSLPGYGFSDGAVRPGMGPAQIAVILKNLMKKIGHQKFYIQGGDWGSVIGRAIATLYQDDVLGFHSTALTVFNSCAEILNLLGGYIATLQVEIHQYNRTALTNIAEETGYVHLQATKPDSVGISLSDSPIGLLTYVLEKFSTWTHPSNRLRQDGGLFNHFTREQMIDNLMIYWMTNSMTTAMRLYAEYFSRAHRGLGLDEHPTKVPVWNIKAPNDLFPQPLNKMKFLNVVGVTVLNDGGHFLALELPEAFAADVFKAVEAFKKFHANRRTDL
ncbi:jg20776 [Pararge aegeria aegeria]|uniref:Epoxide hydrolase n=2 Tax=Pararge aegeria TaxID=116150 RepID=A0A8S4SM90_9NEOP|nr:jg20776 [Pararge aegeria aegeria]